MINDKEVWLSKYAETFHDLYWSGPKRNILDNARKLQGNDNYILYVVANPSKKTFYYFTNYETLMEDADAFPNISITVGNTTFKGLRQVLMFSYEMHKAAIRKSKNIVLALFDMSNKDGTVLRKASIWGD